MVTTRSKSASNKTNNHLHNLSKAVKKKTARSRAPKLAAQSPPHPLVESSQQQFLSPDQGSVGSYHSAASSRGHSPYRSVPLNVQKQLAQDIEQAGGIEAFANETNQLTASNQLLCNLCNARENIFGKRGDPIRRKIINLVYHWKEYSRQGTYIQKVLNRLGVVSLRGGTNQTFTPSFTSTPQKERVAFSPVYSSSSESSENNGSEASDSSSPTSTPAQISKPPRWQEGITASPFTSIGTDKTRTPPRKMKPIPPRTGKKNFKFQIEPPLVRNFIRGIFPFYLLRED